MKKRHGLALVILISMTTTSLFSFANNETQYKNQLQQNQTQQKNMTNEIIR